MAPPDDDAPPPDDDEVAGGLASIVSTGRALAEKVGLVAGAASLFRMNQARGFDCPGCAWPDPEPRAAIEFCENGAKHFAHEATRRRVGPDFFAGRSVSSLLAESDRWLEEQGRLTHPMWKPEGADHYQPLSWDESFGRIAVALRGLASPDEAIFYTSGRTSNEAAFLYQLFVRQLGTNNLPDCSNLCHESSGYALTETLGGGKGTVGLEDFALADAIFVIGQNPGTNHPRMMTTLREAKRRGCRIVAVNPLRERALVRFAHPQHPREVVGGTPIADLFLQVRIGGDVALLQAIARELLRLEEEAPGRVLDRDFLREHTEGFDAWREAVRALPEDELVAESGVSRREIRAAAEIYARAERTIVCWAMGLTQHRHAVANVREIVNLLLLRGNVGRPGAGACPVRGHSNVQGDRTMGIWERPRPEFLARLGAEFGFTPPARHGLDSVGAIEAMRDGRAHVFFALGGNFAVATPDPSVTEAALGRCRLTAHVSTTLNRSHLAAGREALILPCLARSERDLQASGPQFVTVEDSMAVVRRSEGRRPPPSPELRSEVAIVAGVARATLGPANAVPWEALCADYDLVRERIARVVPGFESFGERIRRGPLVLPRGARTRHFETATGRARFSVNPRPRLTLAPRELLLTTIRSHDQFNTTVYSDDDRYRGVRGDRRVVLVAPDDIAALGLAEGQRVDVTSRFAGETRSVHGFRVRAHDLPRGCAAAYYPEANALVPISSFAEGSRTPTYKSVVVTLRPAAEPSA
ncbi:MAG TPA: FdhF/YdeP family oxidoreductase [Myxococcota bacterium]|jgi:molybdopterin-dependent oxidoreductase alpha subunit|nr:FdhF/YdeP family oxidoreductase [Myxococcota bacterium]